MGIRSASETLAQVFMALVQRGTIRQKEFADEIELEPRALKRHLNDMLAAGMPIEREEEHPHVFWSVPKGWLPGGIAVSSAEVLDAIRYLMRAPQSPARDRLLERFLHRSGGRSSLPSVDVVVATELDDRQDELVRVFEDALAARTSVAMRFLSTTRGQVEDRSISVQRILFSDPAKLVAVCHRDGLLKWFRLDNVQRARLDADVAYRTSTDEEIDQFVGDTKFGFHQRGEPTTHRFVVRAPEHRWVSSQLGRGVVAEPTRDGVRFELVTAATQPLARFVVSLGEAATVETPELAEAVREIAIGALRGAGGGRDAGSS